MDKEYTLAIHHSMYLKLERRNASCDTLPMVKAGNVGCNESCTGWIGNYNSSKGTRCAKDILAQ